MYFIPIIGPDGCESLRIECGNLKSVITTLKCAVCLFLLSKNHKNLEKPVFVHRSCCGSEKVGVVGVIGQCAKVSKSKAKLIFSWRQNT